MTTKTKSCHCPSEIIPTNYIYCFSYSGGGYMEIPIGLGAISKLKSSGKVFADEERGIFQCNSCGAHFRHGDCWLHTPTGHYVFFGHTCSDKYGLLADRDEWEMEVKGIKARKAAQIQEVMTKELQESVLNANPGLLEAFDSQAGFVQNIRANFERTGFITSRQIDAILAVHEKSKTENKISAKAGKCAVTGTIVSCKPHDNGFGGCVKMTVKVEDNEGCYFVWGTLPTKLKDEINLLYSKIHKVNPDFCFFKGFQVSFTATFTASPKDESFAFFKRPSKPSLVSTEKVEV